MRDMARKSTKPNRSNSVRDIQMLREVERDRGVAWGMEKPRQQKQQCEGHTDVKGRRERQRGAQGMEKRRQQEDRGC